MSHPSRRQILLTGAGLAGAGLASGWPHAARAAEPADQLVVHEWGTFTGVAGLAGDPVRWQPLQGPDDLPAFVYSRVDAPAGTRQLTPVIDKMTAALVRMETPVLYFYTEVPMTVSVEVGFEGGEVTEWYPRAERVGPGIDWGTVQLLPHHQPIELLHEGAPSHYYPARATRAAGVRVCDDRGFEYERFLFYRGVGDVPLPLSLVQQDHLLTGRAGLPEGSAVLVFERSGGRAGMRAARVGPGGRIEAARPELRDTPEDGPSEQTELALLRLLTGAGLYQDEAQAMLETWRDHWFEDGLRVFFLLTEEQTESILPLRVQPAPHDLVRVMVARVEVLEAGRLSALRSELAHPELSTAEASSLLRARAGRFAGPTLERLIEQSEGAEQRRLTRLRSPA